MARNPYKSPTFKHSSLESGWPVKGHLADTLGGWRLTKSPQPVVPWFTRGILAREKRDKKGGGVEEEGKEREQFSPPVHTGDARNGGLKNQVFSFDRKGGREIVTDLRALSFSR